MSRRARIALATMFAWLLALEVLPNLHLATHDRTAHHHDANGDIVFDPQTHTHTHVHGEQRRRPTGPGCNLPSDADPNHGANSYAHRTASLKPPGAVVIEPVPVGFVATYLVAAKPGILYSIAAARPRARGPPALTST